MKKRQSRERPAGNKVARRRAIIDALTFAQDAPWKEGRGLAILRTWQALVEAWHRPQGLLLLGIYEELGSRGPHPKRVVSSLLARKLRPLLKTHHHTIRKVALRRDGLVWIGFEPRTDPDVVADDVRGYLRERRVFRDWVEGGTRGPMSGRSDGKRGTLGAQLFEEALIVMCYNAGLAREEILKVLIHNDRERWVAADALHDERLKMRIRRLKEKLGSELVRRPHR